VVWLFNPKKIEGNKAKLLQRWFGPYVIRDIKNGGRVIYLSEEDGTPIKLPYNVNRVFPLPSNFHSSNSSHDHSHEVAYSQGFSGIPLEDVLQLEDVQPMDITPEDLDDEEEESDSLSESDDSDEEPEIEMISQQNPLFVESYVDDDVYISSQQIEEDSESQDSPPIPPLEPVVLKTKYKTVHRQTRLAQSRNWSKGRTFQKGNKRTKQ